MMMNIMAAGNEPLTFDALTAVYRQEKNSTALSQIRRDFYTAVQDLIAEQAKRCDRLAGVNPDSVVYEGELQRKKKILQYLKKIVELRMNKISGMAVRGAMGANNVIEDLTPEEKAYYTSVLESSKELWRLSERKRTSVTVPDITEPPVQTVTPEPVSEAHVQEEPERTVPEEVHEDAPIDEESPGPVPEPVQEKRIPAEDIPLSEIPVDDSPDDMIQDTYDIPPEEEDEPPVAEVEPLVPEEGVVTIRILEDMPPFSGPDRDYTLSKEDIVRMPAMMAAALINRGKAIVVPTA